MNKIYNNKGTTLIEVLISMVIFAIGLLGVAGLQLVGIQQNQQSLFRSQATQLAHSISEKIISNESGARASEYNFTNIPNDIIDGLSLDENNLPPLKSSQMKIVSSKGATATKDINEWVASLGKELPSGQGLISCNDDPCNEFSQGVIIVTWNERADRRDKQSADTYVTKKIVLNTLF